VIEVVEDCVLTPPGIHRGVWTWPLRDAFPLPRYADAPAAGTWQDPEPVIGDSRHLYYEHEDDVVVLRVRRAGATVELDCR
jgi:hypothetical protein